MIIIKSNEQTAAGRIPTEAEMTAMLQSLKHRGPDSTGYALYGAPKGNALVMRWKAAEQEEMNHGFHIQDVVKQRKKEVEKRLKELGANVVSDEDATPYAYRSVLDTLFHALVRYAAPILCFTAEEVWGTRYPEGGSVHLLEWPEVEAGWRDDDKRQEIIDKWMK